LFNQAYSFKPQSTIGDITRQTVTAIYNDDYPSEIIQQVHDSAIFQLPFSKHIKDNAAYISKVAFSPSHLRPMLSYSGHDFYIESDAKIGYSCGKRGSVALELTEDVDKQTEFLKEALDKLDNA
jgi:hypothetical protein